jgi:hypothetical protein
VSRAHSVEDAAWASSSSASASSSGRYLEPSAPSALSSSRTLRQWARCCSRCSSVRSWVSDTKSLTSPWKGTQSFPGIVDRVDEAVELDRAVGRAGSTLPAEGLDLRLEHHDLGVVQQVLGNRIDLLVKLLTCRHASDCSPGLGGSTGAASPRQGRRITTVIPGRMRGGSPRPRRRDTAELEVQQ